jgi:hypothetical protein
VELEERDDQERERVESEGAKLDFLFRLFRPSTPNTLDNVRVEGDLDLSQGGQVLIRNGLTSRTVLLDNGGGIVLPETKPSMGPA